MNQPLELTTSDLPNCQLIEQNISPDSFDDKHLPSDTHIICYSINNSKFFDAVRAFSKVDIFDAYHDQLNGKGKRPKGVIHEIKSGYGRMTPRQYGTIKNDSDS